jgi:hypothetical protein
MSTAGGARHPHAETDVHAEHIPEMVELDRDECLHLLAATNFGRLAVNAPGWPPVIPPVTYLFRRSPTSPGSIGSNRSACVLWRQETSFIGCVSAPPSYRAGASAAGAFRLRRGWRPLARSPGERGRSLAERTSVTTPGKRTPGPALPLAHAFDISGVKERLEANGGSSS